MDLTESRTKEET